MDDMTMQEQIEDRRAVCSENIIMAARGMMHGKTDQAICNSIAAMIATQQATNLLLEQIMLQGMINTPGESNGQ